MLPTRGRCRRREDAAIAFAEPFGAKSFSDYKTLAENSEIDAVNHFDSAKLSSRDRDIFYESRCQRFVRKTVVPVRCRSKTDDRNGRKNGVVFTMATKFRYCEDVVKAKAILASGFSGEIVSI